MKLTKRIVWGILLIAAGVLIALLSLGAVTLPFDLRPGDVILGIGVLLVLVEGISRLAFAQTFLMAGIELIIFEEEIGSLLGKTEDNWINNWAVILISLLIGIGFDMIFNGIKDRIKGKKRKLFTVNATGFGDHVKYIDSSKMHTEYYRNNFGDAEIHFENADRYEGGATLTVDNAFGDMMIYVPREWEVSVDIDSSFGDVDVSPELCVAYGDDSGKKLVIKGTNRFGDLEIRAK